MVGSKKTTAAILFSLLFAAAVCFAALTSPVLADSGKGDPDKDKIDKQTLYEDKIKEIEADGVVDEEEAEGVGVHQDPETFHKNFRLSPEQKEYSITAIEDIVSNILDPNMSDLEKYYRLAVWQNMHVTYDSEFWDGKYEFEFYRHQWDAYGVLTDESVCAGMATFYANLCHAADLACKFARLKEGSVDHTINYIPDINGNAYYADVTENDFLMGPEGGFVEYVDKEFSKITKDPTESTFEYWSDDYLHPTNLRECYEEKRKNWSRGEFKVTYEEWFNEYALHDERFGRDWADDYYENGSGLPSTDVDYHHASYRDFDTYPPQPYEDVRSSGATGIWFLDDFYEEPTDIKAKIESKEFDEQLLDINGIKGNYDGCTTSEELEAAVKSNISIRYFPTYKNGKIVAEGANLTCGTHYTVTCSSFDESNGEAEITIQGDGGYTGTCKLHVSLNSAVVNKAPTQIKGLAYNGSSQALIMPGKATNGTMVYAACKAGDPEPVDKYSDKIPTGTKAGKYDVWYKAKGNEGYSDSKAQRLEKAVTIAPMESEILSDNVTVKVGETVQLNPVLNTGRAATYTYGSYKDEIATVSEDGVVTGVAEGVVGLVIIGKLSNPDPNYAEPDIAMISVEVIAKDAQQPDAKAANPMTLKGKTAKVKRSKLKKKAQTIKCASVIKVNNAQGDLAYRLVSAKKGKKSFKKKFKIDAMTGKVTVKKGLKKGTYKVKVKVKAAGNSNYESSAWKNVTFKIKVK